MCNKKYIELDALLAWYVKRRAEESHRMLCNKKRTARREAGKVISLLAEMYSQICKLSEHTADVEEVKHGKWKVYHNARVDSHQCSVCKATWGVDTFRYKIADSDNNLPYFCPNCGAKMDGDKKEENTVLCKECKYLMFSDCYGECKKGYRGIVHPDDTCEYGVRADGREKKK